MEAWWSALDLTPQIFYVIGIVSGMMLLVQLALTVLGADGDADAVEGVDGDVSPFSIRTVTAFFVGFGWTGVGLLQSGYSTVMATLGGLFVGGLFMLGVLVLMRFVYSLQASGTVDFQRAVDLEGTVYVPVAPANTGTGQIELMIQGRHRVLDARTHCERRLERGERVRVMQVLGSSTMVVEPVE